MVFENAGYRGAVEHRVGANPRGEIRSILRTSVNKIKWTTHQLASSVLAEGMTCSRTTRTCRVWESKTGCRDNNDRKIIDNIT